MPERLRNLLVAAIVGGLAIVGFFLHGVFAGVVLLLTAAILGSLSWVLRDRVRPEGRPFRIAIILLLVVIAVIKFAQG